MFDHDTLRRQEIDPFRLPVGQTDPSYKGGKHDRERSAPE